MDPYKILGVKKKATKEEIKKAYKDLAKEHHPDKGGDEENFKKISEAYATLIDDDKRFAYDKFGMHPESEEFRAHLEAIALMKRHVFERLNEKQHVQIEEIQSNLRKTVRDMENEIENIVIMLELLENSQGKVKPIKKLKFNCYDTAINELADELINQLKERKARIKRIKKVYDIVSKYKTIPSPRIATRQPGRVAITARRGKIARFPFD